MFLRVMFEYVYCLFIHLFIHLFIIIIYQILIRSIFMKNLSGYISENDLYIMIYKYDSFKFELYSL